MLTHNYCEVNDDMALRKASFSRECFVAVTRRVLQTSDSSAVCTIATGQKRALGRTNLKTAFPEWVHDLVTERLVKDLL